MKHLFSIIIVLFVLVLVCLDTYPRYMNHFDPINAGDPKTWGFTSHHYYMMQGAYCRELDNDMDLFYKMNGYYPSSYGDIHGLIDRYYHGKHGVAVYVSNDRRHYVSFVVDKKYVMKIPIIGGLKKQVPDECTREELYWRNNEGELELLEVFYLKFCSSNNRIKQDLLELGRKLGWCIREYNRISEQNDNEAYVNLKDMLNDLLKITDDIERLVMQISADVPVSISLLEKLEEVHKMSDKIRQLEESAQTDMSHFEGIRSILKGLGEHSQEFDFLLIPPDTVFRRL